MRIDLTNTYIKQENYLKNSKSNKNLNSVDFTGLTAIAKKQRYPSPAFLKAACGVYTKSEGCIGNISGEFIKAIKTNKPNITKNELEFNIKKVKNAIGQTGQLLRKANVMNKKAFSTCVKNDSPELFNNFCEIFKKSLNNQKSKYFFKEKRFIIDLTDNTRTFCWCDKQKYNKIIRQAELTLKRGLREAGVINKNHSVKLSNLGEGMFGECFKIDIKNNKGDELFIPKVIKVYKDDKLQRSLHVNTELTKFKMLNKYASDFNKFLTDLYEKDPDLENFTIESAKHALQEDMTYSKIMSEESLKENQDIDFLTWQLYMKNKHGLVAEANTDAFVKKACGHKLDNSDLSKYHHYDLKNKIGFSDFAQGKVNSYTSLEDIGLLDTDNHFGNKVNQIRVDKGGYIIDSPDIVKNSAARRIKKKIAHTAYLNKKIELWNEYYQKACENKISNKNDVLIGLREALKLIPIESLGKLNLSEKELEKMNPVLAIEYAQKKAKAAAFCKYYY